MLVLRCAWASVTPNAGLRKLLYIPHSSGYSSVSCPSLIWKVFFLHSCCFRKQMSVSIFFTPKALSIINNKLLYLRTQILVLIGSDSVELIHAQLWMSNDVFYSVWEAVWILRRFTNFSSRKYDMWKCIRLFPTGQKTLRN